MKIFDAMVQAVGRARANDRTPRRWELNTSGYYALLADERTSQQDSKGDVPPKFFNVPWTIDRTDQSDDPKFKLIVDEVAAQYVDQSGGTKREGGLTADEFRNLFNKDRMLPVLLLDGELTVPAGLNGDNIILHGQRGEFPLAWFKPNPLTGGIFQFAWEGGRYEMPGAPEVKEQRA